jgi:hypothetical protein
VAVTIPRNDTVAQLPIGADADGHAAIGRNAIKVLGLRQRECAADFLLRAYKLTAASRTFCRGLEQLFGKNSTVNFPAACGGLLGVHM